jgi:transcription elongation factor GreA
MIEYFTLESKLADLKKKLHNSEVIEAIDDGKVSVGKEITIAIDGEQKKFIFDGISYDNNVITPESPIGKAIIRKKVGNVVEYTLPAGTKVVKILNIELIK